MKKEVTLTEKQTEIWNAIKDLEVSYYAVPNLTTKDICEPINVVPESLYLTLKGPAAIVALEDVLTRIAIKNFDNKRVQKYVLERKDRFAVISDNPDAGPLIKK